MLSPGVAVVDEHAAKVRPAPTSTAETHPLLDLIVILASIEAPPIDAARVMLRNGSNSTTTEIFHFPNVEIGVLRGTHLPQGAGREDHVPLSGVT